MADNEKQYPQDTEGVEYVTNALMDMANSFPGLEPGERFKFSTTNLNDGLNLVATSGSFIIDDHESVTGHVWQTCAYPFMLIQRSSGLNSDRKIATKEWMDTLCQWFARKAITIDGETFQMKKWPVLSGDREIRNIVINTPAYLAEVSEDKAETWVVQLTAQYFQEFDR